jgi:hypothetical protein
LAHPFNDDYDFLIFVFCFCCGRMLDLLQLSGSHQYDDGDRRGCQCYVIYREDVLHGIGRIHNGDWLVGRQDVDEMPVMVAKSVVKSANGVMSILLPRILLNK